MSGKQTSTGVEYRRVLRGATKAKTEVKTAREVIEFESVRLYRAERGKRHGWQCDTESIRESRVAVKRKMSDGKYGDCSRGTQPRLLRPIATTWQSSDRKGRTNEARTVTRGPIRSERCVSRSLHWEKLLAKR